MWLVEMCVVSCVWPDGWLGIHCGVSILEYPGIRARPAGGLFPV